MTENHHYDGDTITIYKIIVPTCQWPESATFWVHTPQWGVQSPIHELASSLTPGCCCWAAGPHVEASVEHGRTRWMGEGRGLPFRLCQAIKRVLAEDETRPWWSQRARTQLEEMRGRFPWLTPESTVVVASQDGSIAWWTFAGRNANAAIAPAVANRRDADHQRQLGDRVRAGFAAGGRRASYRGPPVLRARRTVANVGPTGPGMPEVLTACRRGLTFTSQLPGSAIRWPLSICCGHRFGSFPVDRGRPPTTRCFAQKVQEWTGNQWSKDRWRLPPRR